MKKNSIYIWIFTFMLSCNFSQVNLENNEIDSIVSKTDSLFKSNSLNKVFYPHKSGCGGAL